MAKEVDAAKQAQMTKWAKTLRDIQAARRARRAKKKRELAARANSGDQDLTA